MMVNRCVLGNKNHKSIEARLNMIAPQESSDEYISNSTQNNEECIFQLALESTDESSKAFLDANDEFEQMFDRIPAFTPGSR
jgi:hypothetical protein